jgi:hypothetical protein
MNGYADALLGAQHAAANPVFKNASAVLFARIVKSERREPLPELGGNSSAEIFKKSQW